MVRNDRTRRNVLTGSVALLAGLAAPGLVAARPNEPRATIADTVRRNASSFTAQDWRDHFDDLGLATIVADTTSRALHFWIGDGRDYRIYPTSVPIS